jgi:hypothetical protein
MAGENLLEGKVDMRKEGRNGPMHVQMGTQGHPTQASPIQLSLSSSYSRLREVIIPSIILFVNFGQKIENKNQIF